MTTTKKYEKYGTHLTTEQAKKEIEELCSVIFIEHDSLYWGIYYCTQNSISEEVIQIKNNLDPFDNEPIEDCDFTVIVYVDNVLTNNNKLIAESKNFTLISREVV